VPAGSTDSWPRSTAASNINATDPKSDVAPTPPTADLGDNAGPHDDLRAARAALVSGHT
jgi:hypothetical protein